MADQQPAVNDLTLSDQRQFAAALQGLLSRLDPGIGELEPYEFRYALDIIAPPAGWGSVPLEPLDRIEQRVSQADFFNAIQSKPRQGDKIVLDESLLQLTRGLFAGLIAGVYPLERVIRHFYFDLRSFAFFVRTPYFTPQMKQHFGGRPYRQFEPLQPRLLALPEIGYADFSAANALVDGAIMDVMKRAIEIKGTPILVTVVGPTAAGKSEIVARLQAALAQAGQASTTIEMDNFMIDRELRDGRPVGIGVIHYGLFKQCITDLLAGKVGQMPRYDFVLATSSHDPQGNLRPGQGMIAIQPAQIILLEGNFPFHIPEIAPLIGIKVVYLTDDPVRLKRKWRRDVDYRKKYDPSYLVNHFFKTQSLRNQQIYQPMMAVAEMVVDTTGAALWVEPGLAERLDGQHGDEHV